jgi:hypothetical protein
VNESQSSSPSQFSDATRSGQPATQQLQDFVGEQLPTLAELIGQLQREVRTQRALVVGMLLGLVVLSASVNIMTAKQMRMAREQLNALRPQVLRMYGDFRQQREPALRSFVGQLEAFAETNRNFASVLDRFRPVLPNYFTGVSVPRPVLAPMQPGSPASAPVTNSKPAIAP